MSQLCVLDLETFYDREFSLSRITTEAYVRDSQFETIGLSYTFGNKTEWLPRPKVNEFLRDTDWSDTMIVAQNTAFDGSILSWHYDVQPKAWLDIMGMSRALFPHEKSHSLKSQAERMGVGVKGDEVLNALGKRYKDFTPEELARYGMYCNNDVDLTHKLFKMYMGMGFPLQELKLIDMTLRMFIEPRLILDVPMLQQHLELVRSSKLALLERVRDNMLRGMDPEAVRAVFADGTEGIKTLLMSNAKFAQALRDLGVEPPMKISLTTKKPAYAFAKTDDAFKELAEHEDPDVQALVAARLGNKTTLEETRTERFIDMATRGAFPVPLRYYGAHSGRWSGQDSVNMQNLPSRGPDAGKIKKAIKAPPGHVVIDCDSAQIEARVLAWLAGQDELVQAFKDKQDVYRLMAAKIYGIPLEDVTTGAGSQRQVGKTAVLGCFGSDTLVLTQRGWVPIIQVLGTDTVWDGDEWVQHHGVVPQGEKEVLTTLGLSATADHEILTERGWVAWSEVLANLFHLRSALSLASLPASVGNVARTDLSGKASMVISPICAARAGGKASWTAPTSVGGVLRGATRALKRKLNALAPPRWGLRQFAQTQRTGSGYSQGLAPSLVAAQTPATRSILITEVVESRYIPRGLKSAWSSCNTLSGSTAGTPPSWSSTALTTPAGTFRAIFGLSVKAQTIPTVGAQPPERLKPCVVSCDSLKQRMQTYDIAYSGPRNRYTVLTSEGPIIVHNCGYGVGHVKLQAFLKTQAGVVVSLDESKRIIDTYRSSAFKIVDFWRNAGDALKAMLTGQSMQIDAVGLIKAIPGKGLTLPSGLHIQYPGLREVANPDTGKFELVYYSKGLPVRIYGGKVVENVCQAVARQVVAEQMLRAAKRYKVVLTVHDAIAIIAKESEAQEAQAYLEECMSWNPKWAVGLPLACESGIGRSYGDC
jgi:hypothetical protein